MIVRQCALDPGRVELVLHPVVSRVASSQYELRLAVVVLAADTRGDDEVAVLLQLVDLIDACSRELQTLDLVVVRVVGDCLSLRRR